MSLKYIGTAMMTDQDYVKLFPLSNGWQGKKKKRTEKSDWNFSMYYLELGLLIHMQLHKLVVSNCKDLNIHTLICSNTQSSLLV